MSILPVYIPNTYIDNLIGQSLAEDVGTGDVTSMATVPADRMARGAFVAKEDGVAAGLWIADRVFENVDNAIRSRWHVRDGDLVAGGSEIGTVQGPARGILTAERLTLNLMQRMSGIATMTRAMVDRAAPHGAKILDTRKTAPGLRPLDKWAVRLGGGDNHRMGLFDMILIKDNHIAAAGGIRQALEAARRYRSADGRRLQIELEVRTMEELEEALEVGGADILLLDNMARLTDTGVDVTMLEEAVRMVGGRAQTEASGNVTLETVEAIARTGVDYISSGALTHSTRALDIALNIELVPTS